jgi:hypothetical protein
MYESVLIMRGLYAQSGIRADFPGGNAERKKGQLQHETSFGCIDITYLAETLQLVSSRTCELLLDNLSLNIVISICPFAHQGHPNEL